MQTIENICRSGRAGLEEVLKIFDEARPVPPDFMRGRWKGSEIKTGHPFDGLLAASGWYGKLFLDAERVHPLLFYTVDKAAVFAVNPALVPLRIIPPKLSVLRYMLNAARPIIATRKPKARLRMMEYRGKSTATMCYDDKPIFDHFVRVDDRRVLGLMDWKGSRRPFAFLLERDDERPLRLLFQEE